MSLPLESRPDKHLHWIRRGNSNSQFTPPFTSLHRGIWYEGRCFGCRAHLIGFWSLPLTVQWKLRITKEGALSLRQLKEHVGRLEADLDRLRQTFASLHSSWEVKCLNPSNKDDIRADWAQQMICLQSSVRSSYGHGYAELSIAAESICMISLIVAELLLISIRLIIASGKSVPGGIKGV